MMVMGTIHQVHVSSMTGLHLKGGEAVLAGSPQVGKVAFTADPAAGIPASLPWTPPCSLFAAPLRAVVARPAPIMAGSDG